MAKTNHFLGQMSPRAGILTSLFLKLTWMSVKTLANELLGHHGQHDPFSRSNEPHNTDPEIQRQFFQKFTWTFVKTLAIKPVGHHSQNDPFSRSNDCQSRRQFSQIFYGCPLRHLLWSQLALTSKTSHFQGQTSPGVGKTPHFANFHVPSYGASRPRWLKRPISKVKQAPEISTSFFLKTYMNVNPAYDQFFVCYRPWIFVGAEFRRHLFQEFTWTSLKTFAMEQVDHHGQNNLFSRSNDPHNMEPIDLDGQNSPFSRSNKPPNRLTPILPFFQVLSSMDFW
ncbi:hypothetical protein H5410_031963 [Solanum commersonii]|uniref:Uncharacterized protein n=1 Tax=Solanum commersonii TaxID=4109 RepID=A0A9J5YJT8_SOLCO|nr:hypothetical protein H5410_031963 [Solanum commersonii]